MNLLELIIIVCLLAIDQITKYLISLNLSTVGTSLPLIDGFVQFTNVHNTGAAWGMLEGFRWLFIPLTILIAIIILFVLLKQYSRIILREVEIVRTSLNFGYTKTFFQCIIIVVYLVEYKVFTTTS